MHSGLPQLVFERMVVVPRENRLGMWGRLVGEKVRHQDLGTGHIADVEGMGGWTKLVIAFSEREQSFTTRALASEAFTAMSLSRSLGADLGLQDELEGDTLRSYCERRGITRLVHFTQLDNLDSILTNGLVPRQALEDRVARGALGGFSCNDPHRMDKHRDANCLSISFPNYRMFFRYRSEGENKSKDKKWVVLAFDPEVLWEFESAFCRTNAASTCVSKEPIERLKNVDALRALFGDLEGTKREHLRIPDAFPTDPQAEVLVFGTIQPRYLASVFFDDIRLLRQWSQTNGNLDWSSLASHSPDWFAPRVDHPHWKTSDRAGA